MTKKEPRDLDRAYKPEDGLIKYKKYYGPYDFGVHYREVREKYSKLPDKVFVEVYMRHYKRYNGGGMLCNILRHELHAVHDVFMEKFADSAFHYGESWFSWKYLKDAEYVDGRLILTEDPETMARRISDEQAKLLEVKKEEKPLTPEEEAERERLKGLSAKDVLRQLGIPVRKDGKPQWLYEWWFRLEYAIWKWRRRPF